jgi:hypothetical protein
MTQAPVFSSAAEAADLARAGLRYLAAADPTGLTAAEQARQPARVSRAGGRYRT